MLTRNPNAGLLIVQVLSILVYPFFEDTTHAASRSVFGFLGLAVLAMAIRAVNATRAWTWIAIALGAVVVVFTVIDAVTGWAQPWHLWSDIAHFLLYLYTTIALITYMFRDDEVTSDDLFAVGACFTLGVWTFAYAYSIVQTVYPGSFAAAVNSEQARTWVELLFLSCTTMTSTGLSDVVPVRPQARSIVMIEQIAGMLYVAMVVARLVGLAMRRAAARATSHTD